eukprot:TRINITY_DN5172_c0_g1_i2.p1 TRINITY_DN5172_c0_g1~~TRINITY_DN5172_c0_g1_i2.p1  ORF type:complete len:197 (+),score=33.75 TRINITY_DN5172_c0_g1_i2:238-828(+)
MGLESYCTVRDFIRHLLPGERCNVTLDCITSKGKCVGRDSCMHRANCSSSSKLCRGRGMYEFCNKDCECNEELYCGDHGICVPAVEPGQSCKGEKRCRSNSFCYDDTCTVFGALEIGTLATVVAACRSYFIHKGKCAAGPKRQGNETCPKSGECKYKVGNSEIYEPCVCAKDEAGSRVCPPGIGDINISPVTFYLS